MAMVRPPDPGSQATRWQTAVAMGPGLLTTQPEPDVDAAEKDEAVLGQPCSGFDDDGVV